MPTQEQIDKQRTVSQFYGLETIATVHDCIHALESKFGAVPKDGASLITYEAIERRPGVLACVKAATPFGDFGFAVEIDEPAASDPVERDRATFLPALTTLLKVAHKAYDSGYRVS